MNLKYAIFGVVGLAASLSASAQTIDYGSYLLDFDETTAFGAPVSNFTGSGGSVGFSWSVPTSVNVVSTGALVENSFALPSFTITPNAGYKLSGPLSGFLGNLVFTEFGGSTSAVVAGALSVNGSPAIPFSGALDKIVTTSVPGVFSTGYYVATGSAAIGDFSSFSFSGGSLILSAFGGNGAIVGQNQNELTVGFVASPVPLPMAAWLLASAVASLGVVRRRIA